MLKDFHDFTFSCPIADVFCLFPVTYFYFLFSLWPDHSWKIRKFLFICLAWINKS